MTLEKGFVLLAVDEHENAIDDAKKYISENGLTSDQVRITRKDGQIQVITKLPLIWGQE